jgi:hypothetical protein
MTDGNGGTDNKTKNEEDLKKKRERRNQSVVAALIARRCVRACDDEMGGTTKGWL